MSHFKPSPGFRALACAVAFATQAACAATPAGEAPPATGAVPPAPTHDVIGVQEQHLQPQYWILRAPSPSEPIANRAEVEQLNARLQEVDPTINALEELPASMPAAEVRKLIESLSSAPTETRYDDQGKAIAPKRFAELADAMALDAIPANVTPQFGLVTHRASLRTFPTTMRVFRSAEDRDIDRFQESALFPGMPVAVLHESRDKAWSFVVSANYEAWIESKHVARGSRDAVFGYARKQPYLVVTGATAETVYNPDLAAVSELQLDMGTRVPLRVDWPIDKPVNGQHPYAAHVIELPIRNADGTLGFAPALLPRTADVAADYLPMTRANILSQSFKFLGERYGWGHSYEARDCSGFVSEVYRSMGIALPRNTGDQAKTTAFERIALDGKSHEERLKLLATLDVGDLVYIPGHVMMVIGQENGAPYVIHDTTGITYRDAGGALKRVRLNQVSVTPLAPLMFGEGEPTVDRITAIQRIRPRT